MYAHLISNDVLCKEVKIFRVRIDLALLRDRLSNLTGQFTTNGDVILWLLGRGLTIDRGSWIASLPQLRHLELKEIISSCPLGSVSDAGE